MSLPPPPPQWLRLLSVLRWWFFVVDSFLIVTPIVGFCNCSMFCYALLYVLFSFAIVLMEKRELVVLLSLSIRCLVIVVWLFLAVLWGCLQFVIVVFPDHTYLLFLFADLTSYDMYFKHTKSRTRSENVKFICFPFILFVKNVIYGHTSIILIH